MLTFKTYIHSKVHPKYKHILSYNDDDNNYHNTHHIYSIKKRLNLTHIESYSIDPITCTDVDDAFSVWFNNKKIMKLAIHIADPTYYFSPNCKIFSKIQKNSMTHYPSNKNPIHMMPKSILSKANLMVNADSSTNSQHKNAMTVIFTIDEKTYLPIDYDICSSVINVKRENKLSYDINYNEKHNPSVKYKDTVTKNREDSIFYGLLISKALRKKRNSAVEKMVEYNRTYFSYDKSDTPYFVNASDKAMELKKMIEEFAILTNDSIGAYLHNNDSSYGFYRSCIVDKEGLLSLEKKESNEEILKFIITNGVQAYYNEKSGVHDLVNKSHYTHFTSPLRRFTDCITHFILKSIMLHTETPFTIDELKNLSDYSNKFGKLERNIQFEDKKVNTLWALKNLLIRLNSDKEVFIRVKFMGYINNFLNFMIYNVIIKNKIGTDEQMYYTHISYSARLFNYKYLDFLTETDYIDIKLNDVNCIKKFDIGILPDLEKFINKPK